MHNIEVLYEDNHLIAVRKPSGLLTQEAEGEKDSLENRIKEWLRITCHKPGQAFIGVVHRLDRPVSGIVLFAKTSKALTRLNDSIRKGEMHKTYRALVEGTLKSSHGTLEHHLRHDDYRSSISVQSDPSAKLARLHYSVLEEQGSFSLVEIHLETGRYHQIRAQFSAIGHPVAGDVKYGARKPLPDGAIALQHTKLTFIHPVTKVPITVVCEPDKWTP